MPELRIPRRKRANSPHEDAVREEVQFYVDNEFARSRVDVAAFHFFTVNDTDYVYCIVETLARTPERWEMLLFQEEDGWTVHQDGFDDSGDIRSLPVGSMCLADVFGEGHLER